MAKSADDREKSRKSAVRRPTGEFGDRLDALGDRLQAARGKPAGDDEAARRRGNAMGVAFRIAADLIAGVIVGGFIGWQLDAWLDTKPFLLLIFLVLGTAAGVLNVVRSARRMQQDALNANSETKPSDKRPDAE